MSSPYPRIESGGTYIVDGTPGAPQPIERWVRALDLLAVTTSAAPLLQDKIQPFNCTGGAITATVLPALSGLPLYARFGAAKTDSGANTLTLPFASGDTLLDGSPSVVISAQDTVELQVMTNPSGGKLWRVVNYVRSAAGSSGVSQTQLDNAIAGLVNSAPGALDTLKELADALGDDANYAATITTALSGKQPLDSDLTAIAALSTTSFGRSLLALADAAALRTAAGTDAVYAPIAEPTGTAAQATANAAVGLAIVLGA